MTIAYSTEPLQAAQEASEAGLLDGRAIAGALRAQLIPLAAELTRRLGRRPSLALVRAGEDEASAIYVRNKVRACAEIGIESIYEHHPSTVTEVELLGHIAALNARDDVDAILVQTPLPAPIDEMRAILEVDPHKDADGFHPNNLGRLMAGTGNLEPCTPRGVMTMLQAAGCDPQGLRATVVGRSMIVGRPMAQMLTRADATVTVCHRHTGDLAAEVGRADLVVVATGVPHLVRGAWIKEGAVVVDIGISRLPEGKLSGDVEFELARERASLISPVPRGVGPMTVATLMENCLRAAAARAGYTRVEPLRIGQASHHEGEHG